MKTQICSTIRINGFHNWPNALEVVDYLSARHRHLFTFKVWADVNHDDRDIEFQMLQRTIVECLCDSFDKVEEYLPAIEFEFGSTSCEGIARKLFGELEKRNVPVTRIEVWEDDENGASLEKE